MPGHSRIRRPFSSSSCAISETDRRHARQDPSLAKHLWLTVDHGHRGPDPRRPRLRYHPPMPPPRSLLLDRFKRLPRRSGEVWQGGVVRARTWIEQPDGSVQRPWAAVWVSLGTGMINVGLVDDAADAEIALRTLVD